MVEAVTLARSAWLLFRQGGWTGQQAGGAALSDHSLARIRKNAYPDMI
jgi:hypothetical protein